MNDHAAISVLMSDELGLAHAEMRFLRAYAAGLDRREFAICAGSVGLTMADSFVRHGRAGEAGGAVPGMVRALKQALSLAGA